MLAALGGHAVGMSTVLECIAARWVGLEVCGVSLVTNAGAGYSGRAADPRGGPRGRAPRPGPRLARVIRRFVADLPTADRGVRRSTRPAAAPGGLGGLAVLERVDGRARTQT